MGTFEKIAKKNIKVQRQEPMAPHTTFRIGGPAELFILPKSIEELKVALDILKQDGQPYRILGKGSNLLVNDEGISGAVISMEGISGISVQGCMVKALAGESLTALAKRALEHGLSGLEFAYGIPASVGGAVVMNAGAYGGEIKDVLKSVQVLTPDGEIKELGAEQLRLGYRTSCVEDEGYIVFFATMELKSAPQEEIRAQMEKNINSRREKQPLEYPSAGSTFKRPEKNFAGKLIMDAGLSGISIGDAQVSKKHCGFVINRGNATAKEVRELIDLIKKRVFEEFNIELECEVRMW